MRKASMALVAPLFICAFVVSIPLLGQSQTREKFVISARAGGVNAVTGGASMRAHGNSEWQQLSIKEDLKAGDVVKTAHDGRVEMLLNPGSYLRIGENSEFELADNSLENLEVKLVRGTAILEVTGAEDTDLLINITTPHTRMAIIRRGLYRVNVVPGDTTELIVRKGRVMLDSHTKIKGGNKMIFSGTSTPAVAKLEKSDKDKKDTLEAWSKERGRALAQANSKLSWKNINALRTGFAGFWPYEARYRGHGVWIYRPALGCYTFVPFGFGWGSPYGITYSSFFWGNAYNCCGRRVYDPWPTSSGSPTGTSGARTQGGSSGVTRPSPPPSSFPGRMGGGKRDVNRRIDQ